MYIYLFFKLTVLVTTHFTKYFTYNRNFDIVIVAHFGIALY